MSHHDPGRPPIPDQLIGITAMQDYFEERQDQYRAPALTTTIPRAAVAPVDALQRKIILSGARVVALSAPHREAATVEVSRMPCQSFAASGIKTLHDDATAELHDDDELNAWEPGEPNRDGHIENPTTANSTELLRITAQTHQISGESIAASMISSLPMNPERGGRPVMAMAATKNIPATKAPPAIGAACSSRTPMPPRRSRTTSTSKNSAAVAKVEWMA